MSAPEGVQRLLAEGERAPALEAAADSWRAWLENGMLEKGRAALAAVLDATQGDPPTAVRARALYGDGLLAFRQGSQDESRARNEEALVVARAAGDARGEVNALVGLSRIAFRDGDYARVRELAGEARELARATGDPAAETGPLHMLAAGNRLGGDFAAAREFYEANMALNRELGNERSVSMEHHNLGWVALHLDDVDAAARHFAERDPSVDTVYDRAWRSLNAAALAGARGETDEARGLLAEGEAALAQAGMALDPDDQFELEWLRARLA